MQVTNKIPCLSCGRKVKDHPQSKADHILRYHPMAPFKRIVGLFNPGLFEFLGYRIGEKLKAML